MSNAPKSFTSDISGKLTKLVAVILLDLGISFVLVVGLQFYIEKQLTQLVDQAIREHSGDAVIRYRRVKMNLWDQSIQIRGIHYQPAGSEEFLRIDRIALSGIDKETFKRVVMRPGKPTLPKTFRVDVKGLHITPNLMSPKVAESLAALGYETLSFSGGVGFLLDRERDVIGLQNLELAIEDFGRLSTSIELAGFHLPSDADLENQVQIDFSQLKTSSLASFVLQFTDASIMKRVDLALIRSGKPSLSSMMKSLEDAATRIPASGQGSMTFPIDPIRKLASFVQSPNVIRLTAQPPTPLPLVQLAPAQVVMDFAGTVQKLGLKLEVER